MDRDHVFYGHTGGRPHDYDGFGHIVERPLDYDGSSHIGGRALDFDALEHTRLAARWLRAVAIYELLRDAFRRAKGALSRPAGRTQRC